jgi:hypothetical protein
MIFANIIHLKGYNFLNELFYNFPLKFKELVI